MRFFFETKSWRLFSFLFALGFSLQLLRARDRGGRFWSTYLRRLAVLFVIGMLHALLYSGDILMGYAMLGLLLIPFSKAPPRLLLVLAVVLLAVFPIGGRWPHSWTTSPLSSWTTTPGSPTRGAETKSGSARTPMPLDRSGT
jgi:uncharacterized membrane protein YeiB